MHILVCMCVCILYEHVFYRVKISYESDKTSTIRTRLNTLVSKMEKI